MSAAATDLLSDDTTQAGASAGRWDTQIDHSLSDLLPDVNIAIT